jgi:uncharacterized protein (DUF4415 family)
MTEKKKTYRTKTGVVLTDADIERIAEEVAVTDYDVALLKRRRGRPTLGDGPAEIVPVRIDRELVEALDACAEHEHTTRSEVIRKALRHYLAS